MSGVNLPVSTSSFVPTLASTRILFGCSLPSYILIAHTFLVKRNNELSATYGLEADATESDTARVSRETKCYTEELEIFGDKVCREIRSSKESNDEMVRSVDRSVRRSHALF